MMEELQCALQALCTDQNGNARATCPKATYEKYSKPFHH
jgi:hypothetical protein